MWKYFSGSEIIVGTQVILVILQTLVLILPTYYCLLTTLAGIFCTRNSSLLPFGFVCQRMESTFSSCNLCRHSIYIPIHVSIILSLNFRNTESSNIT